MRLYLSSFRFGAKPEKLVALVGHGKRVAVILNALDNFPDQRTEWLTSQTNALSALGFVVDELDLRHYFREPTKLEKALTSTDAVWINGGNAFLLRRAMKQSGFDVAIRRLLDEDRIVYAGFSAAVCCAAPTLRGAEMVDDAHDVPPGYDAEIVWNGLGLLDVNVAVHFESAHSESEAINKEIDFYRRNDVSFKTLRDGQVIIVDGEISEIAG